MVSFYFHPEPWGFMIQFDEHIFQMGWNHQLVVVSTVFFELSPQRNWGKNVPSWRLIGFCELGEKMMSWLSFCEFRALPLLLLLFFARRLSVDGASTTPWKVQAPNPHDIYMVQAPNPPPLPPVVMVPPRAGNIYIYIYYCLNLSIKTCNVVAHLRAPNPR